MEMTPGQERALRVQSFTNALRDVLDPTLYQPNKSSLKDQRYDVSENSAYLKRELETMTPEEKVVAEALLKQAEEFLSK